MPGYQTTETGNQDRRPPAFQKKGKRKKKGKKKRAGGMGPLHDAMVKMAT